jgi:hypothetical protein
LRRIRRDRLDPHLRPVYDDLLIDVLSESGAWDELQVRLSRLAPDEGRPRVWMALETGATTRLARLAQDPDSTRGFSRSLDLWDEVIRLSWPAGSEFPSQFTERVAALVRYDASRRLKPWHDRLRRAGAEMATRPRQFLHASVVATEQTRVETEIGSHSAP